MNYELVNVVNPGTKSWNIQKKRAIELNERIISLAPNSGTAGLEKSEGVKIVNLIDFIVKRKYKKQKGLFFNRAPVPTGAEIFMNQDHSISIIFNGEEIGLMDLYVGTRRYVKSINYKNSDGTPDFSEEYTLEGTKYSTIYYTKGEVQKINFYNDLEQVVVSFFFYEGSINFVVVRDAYNGNIESRYNSLSAFYAEELSKFLKNNDVVNFNFLGIELESLSKSNSHNNLYLEETPLDGEGNMKGNLHFVLQDNSKIIEKLFTSKKNVEILKNKKENLKKVFIIQEPGLQN
ncbi:hypothetical protein ABC426_00100 [Lactiplantibacillus plantarum]|uniref:hypothetical protein n=1 Tax=Lactiplantibacillus plantarum TaxID=1590 RepID=UPI001BADC48C|nr:hypothetical protein [Lactiplantibacillus plantarum]MBS0953225.1 hypothetical protein [Lactiplantibacillus plantarum]WOI05889.1 hypothetical protein RI097_15755 [Lactiplantibacillus plantarum]